jgi:MarR family transcriptional regulator, repressor for mepA
MEKKNEVTWALRSLQNQIMRLSEQRMPRDRRITTSQGRVIGYIKHHPNAPVYQRDLEQEFQIRRSTASAMLKTMVKNDWIRREPVASDARLKRLTLSARAEEFSERVEREHAYIESVITHGVSDDAMCAFFETIAKFEENLKRYADQETAAQTQNTGRPGDV